MTWEALFIYLFLLIYFIASEFNTKLEYKYTLYIFNTFI